MDDIIRLLNTIFFDMGDVHMHIYSFYNKEHMPIENGAITLKTFIKTCERNNILTSPSELFSFLDMMDIKVAIFPAVSSSEWSFRVYHDNEINISDGFSSRKQATVKAIETAFVIYHKRHLKTEKNKDKNT
jgi:hypothetical protein